MPEQGQLPVAPGRGVRWHHALLAREADRWMAAVCAHARRARSQPGSRQSPCSASTHNSASALCRRPAQACRAKHEHAEQPKAEIADAPRPPQRAATPLRQSTAHQGQHAPRAQPRACAHSSGQPPHPPSLRSWRGAARAAGSISAWYVLRAVKRRGASGAAAGRGRRAGSCSVPGGGGGYAAVYADAVRAAGATGRARSRAARSAPAGLLGLCS